MNVLMTGGAGYIGSQTARRALQAGYSVTVLDNLSTGFRIAVPEQASFYEADVRDTAKLKTILKQEKIDAVIHFAAKLIVPESLEKPIEYYANNTQGVVSLVQACNEVGVQKIVFSSTASVYGDTATTDTISETALPRPINPYGFSKLMSEQILHDAETAYGIRSVCLRYFNVAGASKDGKNGQRTLNPTHLIQVAAEVACGKRQKLEVFGADYPTADGSCVRDYIHIEDLADVNIQALEYLNRGGAGAVLNCGYGKGSSVKEVVATMEKVSGKSLKSEVVERRAGDAAMLVADPSRLMALFQWKPKYNDIELICRSAFEWECVRNSSLKHK